MSQPLYESVDPETYLVLAKELALKSEAAAKRTAADRAYYATFWLVEMSSLIKTTSLPMVPKETINILTRHSDVQTS